MLFNLLRGYNPGIDMISGTMKNVMRPMIEQLHIPITPMVVIFRTSVGTSSEMAVYYRMERGAEFTLMTGGSSPATTRLYSEMEGLISMLVSGATTANKATVHYQIWGVRME